MKLKFSWLLGAAIMLLAACNNSKKGGDTPGSGGDNPVPSGEAVDVKLNLQKGKTYGYLMKMDMDMAMEMLGKPINSKMDMDFGFKLNVDDIDKDGNYNMTCTYDEIKFMVNAAGQEMGYDSKNPDAGGSGMMGDMFKKIFGSMVNKQFKMTMSPKGEISKVEGIKELTNSMVDAMDVPAAQKENMRQQMEASFSEEKIKQNFQQGFNVFPDKAVKVGESWHKTMTQDMSNMKMNTDVKFTVKEITGDVVKLDLDGVIESSANEGSAAAGTEMTGTQKGTMVINRSNGLARQSTIDMDAKVKAKGIPMTMKGTITVEGKE